ncbi:MAG: gliding motility-associated C-terminal domain-containing protein [Flavobacteriales bacterium]|nr:gliding motility-associated C-terminal domain-containing protein [Flavobacteriales bacterium]
MKYQLTLILLFLLASFQVSATHIVGGNFKVQQYNGGSNNYKITLTVYRDCTPGTDNSINPNDVWIFENGTNNTKLHFSMSSDLISLTNVNLGDPCYSNSSMCIEKYVYVKTVELAPSPLGYYITWDKCCRNAAIDNLFSPLSLRSTFYTQFPKSSLFGVNTTPEFGDYPEGGYLCVGTHNEIFDFVMTDADGDRLVYSIAECLNANTSKPFDYCPWSFPCSAGNILGNLANPPLAIDPNTGVITCWPETMGTYVISVKVKEYRGANFLGETVQDVQYRVINCGFQQPYLNVSYVSSTLTDITYEGCAQGDLYFSRSDTAGAVVVNLTYGGTATNGVDVNLLPSIVTFPSGVATVTFPVFVVDDGITEGMEILNIQAIMPGLECQYESWINKDIQIWDGYELDVNIVAPSATCEGDIVNLSAIIGNGSPSYTYLWDSVNTSAIYSVNADHDTYYVLEVMDSNECKGVDSVLINISGYFESNAGPDTIICQNEQIILGGTILNPTGPGGSLFSWSPNSLDNISSGNPTTTIDSNTQFIVSVLSLDGCTSTDTVFVEVFGIDIDVNIDTVICAGQLVQLTINGSDADFVQWRPSSVINSAATNPIVSPDTTTTYYVTTSILAGCTDVDTVTVAVHYIPQFGFVMDSSKLVCDGQHSYFSFYGESNLQITWSSSGYTADSILYQEVIGYGAPGTVYFDVVDTNNCQHHYGEIFPMGNFQDSITPEIPNVFTPNGDFKNDIFTVVTDGNFTNCTSLSIYNRWGSLIFFSNASILTWDGRTTQGYEAPTGTYYYILEVVDAEYPGSVTLFR